MNPQNNLLLLGLGLAVLSGGTDAFAATVWNGPLITYNQPGSDPTLPANQDRITPKVALTRTAISGIFNAVSETFYSHLVSPAGTEWAVGSLADYSTLTYKSWEAAGLGHPVLNLPGQQLVLHLIEEDIYLSVKFTALGARGDGGFSYLRSTPPPLNQAPVVAISSPANGATFTSPASVAITATPAIPTAASPTSPFLTAARSWAR